MTYAIHIKPSGSTFTANADETVLAAALRHGYTFPHKTKRGICKACKGQLLEGQVHYDAKKLVLSDEEREAGFALFCLAKPRSDLFIHLEGVRAPQTIPPKKLTYEVFSIEKLSGNTYQVVLQPPPDDRIDYQAGQYIEILHRDASPKPFSIANAPRRNGQLELHIRDLAESPFTADVINEIKTQKKLRIAGPFGNSIYRKDPAYPLILIAGGTGFAPIKSIVEQAIIERLQLPIYLYWGARTFSDLYLHDAALRWAKDVATLRYTPVLSAALPDDHWQGRVGLVHETVLADHQDFSHHHIYASGPPEMVYAALHAFQLRGLDRALMYSDWFDYEIQ